MLRVLCRSTGGGVITDREAHLRMPELLLTCTPLTMVFRRCDAKSAHTIASRYYCCSSSPVATSSNGAAAIVNTAVNPRVASFQQLECYLLRFAAVFTQQSALLNNTTYSVSPAQVILPIADGCFACSSLMVQSLPPYLPLSVSVRVPRGVGDTASCAAVEGSFSNTTGMQLHT